MYVVKSLKFVQKSVWVITCIFVFVKISFSFSNNNFLYVIAQLFAALLLRQASKTVCMANEKSYEHHLDE